MIGGLPNGDAIIFALVVTLLLPIKGILFFFLLLVFKLRARSAFLTGLSLTNFSEFGLIVASLILPEWLVPLALAVSLSFLISAPLYKSAQPLYENVLLTANDVEAKILASQKLRKYGFTGVIISHSSFAEDAAAINAAGANYTHQTFSETGIGLAKHLLKEVDKEQQAG